MFGLATGYLGWSPHDAWHTPIPLINLALDYRIDWMQKTNPFGGGKRQKEQPRKKPTADAIKAAFNTAKAARS